MHHSLMESVDTDGAYGFGRDSSSSEENRSMETCKGSSLYSLLTSEDPVESVNDPCSDHLVVTSSGSSDTTVVENEDEAAVHSRFFGECVGNVGSAGGAASGLFPADADKKDSKARAAPTAVGLINDGCTCYLNSLLQLLFHISYFRTAVYRIPVEADEGPTVYKALQEVFFQMQERTTPARTTVLTNAFGWGRKDLYVQHDIQEMATLLRDHLEERMKGTVTEGAINQLFEGRGEQFVETLDKSYVSRRADTYYDVHIPLGQHRTLLDSLTSLTARDQLVGDNKYRVEREGEPVVYKDAEKGYSYTRFPPVTWFHLKRFAIDFTSPMPEMRKVNAPLEFPLVLDLCALENPGAAEGVGGSGAGGNVDSAAAPFSSDSPAIYDLQGVIVHRGTARSGHYYCYIREWDREEQRFCRWLEYDDENVRVVTDKDAVNDNYGCSSSTAESFHQDTSPMGRGNAYILSYVRRADAAMILAPSPTDIVSDRVKEAMRRAIQEEERQLREAEEARRSVTIFCITDAALRKYCESVCSTELFSRDAQQWRRHADCVLTVHKSDTLTEVYETLAAQAEMARLGVTASNCRIWWCRDASTVRPSFPFPTYEESAALKGLGPQQPQPQQQQQQQQQQQRVCLQDFLSEEESRIVLTMCVYVEQAKVPLPGLSSLTQKVGLIRSFQQDIHHRFYMVELSSPTEAKALHLTLEHSDYPIEVNYKVTTDTEPNVLSAVSVMGNRKTAVLPLNEFQRTVSVKLICLAPNKRRVPVRSVHLELPFRRPLLPPSPTASADEVPVLPVIGYDRVLIFFKYYDYNTVRYVCSRFIDKSAKVYCCEAVYRDSLSFLDDSAHSSLGSLAPIRHPSSPPATSIFCFYLERIDHTLVELNERADLGDLKSGCVLVAQPRAIPASHRHLSIVHYYMYARNSVDVHIVEVQRIHQANDEAYRRTTLERQRSAVAAATAVHSAAEKEMQSTRSLSAAVTTPPLPNSAAPDGGSEVHDGAITAGAPQEMNPTALNNNAESVPLSLATTTPTINDGAGSGGGGAVASNPSTTGGNTSSAGPTSMPIEGASGCKITAQANAVAEADPIRIADTLNPYEALQLPILHEVAVTTFPTEYSCRMSLSWNYETVCAAVGRAIAFEPSHLQLYQSSSSNGEATPEVSPPTCTTRLTLGNLLYVNSEIHVLYYERLAGARDERPNLGVVTATLRDQAGHALHRESYSVNVANITPQNLVRLVCQSVPTWQRETDVWGTIQETLQSSHFTLSFVDKPRHVIAAMCEVPMLKTDAEEFRLDASALRKFEVDLQAAAPLQGTERRIACCHMDYITHNCSASLGHQRKAFGQPFLITTDHTTTVRDALNMLLLTTHLSKDALNNMNGLGVLVAEKVYYLENWDEHLHMCWMNAKNSSWYPPSLVLNHAKPREKPGSRYVPQHSPQLKISNK